jgi:hypothetical protein
MLLTMCAVAGGPGIAAAADAATPSLLWTGAKRIAVNCLVQSLSAGETAKFEKALCEEVRVLAARQAPLPVARVEQGDPALISPDTVTLLVHASIQRTASGRTFVFTIRPYRPSGGDAEVFFGTAPQAVELASAELASAAISPALKASLGAAVADILPWQQEARIVARPL